MAGPSSSNKAVTAGMSQARSALGGVLKGDVVLALGVVAIIVFMLVPIPTWMLHIGLSDQVFEHGDSQKLLAQCGLDADGIQKSVMQRFGTRLTVVRPAAAG